MQAIGAWVSGGLAALVMALPLGPAAAQPAQVDGWRIETLAGTPNACGASGPVDGAAQLGLAAFGPGFLLTVKAPGLAADGQGVEVELSFDGKAPVGAAGAGADGGVQVLFGRGPQAETIAAASQIGVAVAGQTYRFRTPNLRALLEALAKCAGEPPLSQLDAAPTPIVGAEGWSLMTRMVGVPESACTARKPGPQVDTIVTLNKDGDLLLIGGHGDWAVGAGPAQLKLGVDSDPPVALDAFTAQNLILLLIKDKALVQRLRQARTLDWIAPAGTVRGDVTGLGVALDRVARCKSQKD